MQKVYDTFLIALLMVCFAQMRNLIIAPPSGRKCFVIPRLSQTWICLKLDFQIVSGFRFLSGSLSLCWPRPSNQWSLKVKKLCRAAPHKMLWNIILLFSEYVSHTFRELFKWPAPAGSESLNSANKIYHNNQYGKV